MATQEKVDVVIVGAGPSGAVFADVLARAGKKVVVLEFGPDWDMKEFVSSEMWAKRLKHAPRFERVIYDVKRLHTTQARAVENFRALSFRPGAEQWIAQTLESAINQTWPHKEIIVVDDGSRDNTLAIARVKAKTAPLLAT